MITGLSAIVSATNSHVINSILICIQVISYIIIAALADAFPADSNFNRGAAIVQVIGIYVIEMVRLP